MVQGKAARAVRLISIVALLTFSARAEDGGGGEAYVSWGVFEPDKCATVWLIKRHIDPNARFAFVERDADLPKGIAFDTPGAKFRRYHNRCTYETFLEHHQLANERLVHIGRIMHDIEVNVWERKALAETARVEAEILEILSDDDPEGNVDACLAYFDVFYSSL